MLNALRRKIVKLPAASLVALTIASAPALATDLTGGGATFPYPIYANGPRPTRRRPASISTTSPSAPAAASSRSRQDRRFRRVGHAAQAGGTRARMA